MNQGRFVLELVILEGTCSVITFLIWFENAWTFCSTVLLNLSRKLFEKICVLERDEVA